MKQPGVYHILNLTTGRRYVGSSVNVGLRWSEHLSGLRRGVHHCASLQADWTAFGPEAFGWQVLETVEDRSELIEREQSYLDESSLLYNASRRAGSGPRDGFRHTDATKLKLSALLKGRKKSQAHRDRLGLAHIGRIHTAEHREKIRLKLLGGKRSAETRGKMSASRRKITVTWGDQISLGRRAAFAKKQPRVA